MLEISQCKSAIIKTFFNHLQLDLKRLLPIYYMALRDEVIAKWKVVFPLLDKNASPKYLTFLRKFEPQVSFYGSFYQQHYRGEKLSIYLGLKSYFVSNLYFDVLNGLDHIGHIRALKSNLNRVLNELKSNGLDNTHLIKFKAERGGGRYLMFNGGASPEFYEKLASSARGSKKSLCPICGSRFDLTTHHIIPRSALKHFAKQHKEELKAKNLILNHNFEGNTFPICRRDHDVLEEIISVYLARPLDEYGTAVDSLYLADLYILLARFIAAYNIMVYDNEGEERLRRINIREEDFITKLLK